MTYVVNIDTANRSALVHEANCYYYEQFKDAKDPRNGGWHGPFETEEEALTFGKSRKGDARLAQCRKCRIGR